MASEETKHNEHFPLHIRAQKACVLVCISGCIVSSFFQLISHTTCIQVNSKTAYKLHPHFLLLKLYYTYTRFIFDK